MRSSWRAGGRPVKAPDRQFREKSTGARMVAMGRNAVSTGEDSLQISHEIRSRSDQLAEIPLDAHQERFCSAPSAANIRLLAPAGCGKTLCLLARCEHLARNRGSTGFPPRFLLLTFTRAAAIELAERVRNRRQFPNLSNLVQKSPAALDISTLNAWGYRRIRNQTFSPRLLASRQQAEALCDLEPIATNLEKSREYCCGN